MDVKQQLLAMLESEASSLEALHAILLEEHEGLLGQDISVIERLTQSKSRALDAQTDITRQRQQLVARYTDQTNPAPLQTLTATLGQPETILKQIARLEAMARECEQLNRNNGRLILQRHQQTQGALQVLRQTGDSTDTYSGRGKTQAAGASRTLGKA